MGEENVFDWTTYNAKIFFITTRVKAGGDISSESHDDFWIFLEMISKLFPSYKSQMGYLAANRFVQINERNKFICTSGLKIS